VEAGLAQGDAGLELGDMLELRTDHRNIVVHSYQTRLFLWGDVASSYDSSLEIRVYDADGVLYHTAEDFVFSTYQATPINNIKFAAGDRCSALYSPMRTPIGYTSVLYSSTTGVPALPLDADDISRVDVVITSSGEVAESFDMATRPNCHNTLDGNFQVQGFIHNSFPQFCLNGPFTGGLGGGQVALRTALRFNDGPAPFPDDDTWSVRSFLVGEDFGSGVQGVDLYFNGTRTTGTRSRATMNFISPDMAATEAVALPVCGGGTWSGSGGTMILDVGSSQNPQTSVEPLTFGHLEIPLEFDLWILNFFAPSMTYNSSTGL
jgi:hypothetical protein